MIKFSTSYLIAYPKLSPRIDNKLCADRSAHRPNSKYWADKSGSRCYQDYLHPTQDLSVDLYDSIEDCCAFKIWWLSPAKCYVASEVDVPESSGTYAFYVKNDSCVQDCVGDAPCGGLAEKWDTTYDTKVGCCARLHWIPSRDCLLSLEGHATPSSGNQSDDVQDGICKQPSKSTSSKSSKPTVSRSPSYSSKSSKSQAPSYSSKSSKSYKPTTSQAPSYSESSIPTIEV